jgi:putative membrane protein
MVAEIIVRYLHFLCVIILVGALVGEFLLVKPRLQRKEIARILKLDTTYGISSIVLVGAGLTLWMGVGKPADFYTYNWIFHTKLGLVILLGILSIRPTVFFFRERKGTPDEWVDVPTGVRTLIRIEVALLAVIPLLAGLMAKGIGFFG